MRCPDSPVHRSAAIDGPQHVLAPRVSKPPSADLGEGAGQTMMINIGNQDPLTIN
jgi:hypothetical protein